MPGTLASVSRLGRPHLGRSLWCRSVGRPDGSSTIAFSAARWDQSRERKSTLTEGCVQAPYDPAGTTASGAREIVTQRPRSGAGARGISSEFRLAKQGSAEGAYGHTLVIPSGRQLGWTGSSLGSLVAPGVRGLPAARCGGASINERILSVDVEPSIHQVATTYLECDGFIVYSAQDGREGRDLVFTERPAVRC